MRSVESLLGLFKGYIHLGMYTDAHEELERLPLEFKTHALVLEARLLLLIELRKWEKAALLGRSLCRLWPDNIEFYLKAAYCLRKLNRIKEAKETLIHAPQILRETALYYYTLACFETLLNNVAEAGILLKKCFQIDVKFRTIALEEVDLERLWLNLIDCK